MHARDLSPLAAPPLCQPADLGSPHSSAFSMSWTSARPPCPHQQPQLLALCVCSLLPGASIPVYAVDHVGFGCLAPNSLLHDLLE
eukprot:410504-Amphidinium_carterae.1